MARSEDEGAVYVAVNRGMPDLVKIGRTGREDVRQRMAELYGTGVPYPFDVHYAGWVADHRRFEGALHDLFSRWRTPNREFFAIDPETPSIIIRARQMRDVTPPPALYLPAARSLQAHRPQTRRVRRGRPDSRTRGGRRGQK